MIKDARPLAPVAEDAGGLQSPEMTGDIGRVDRRQAAEIVHASVLRLERLDEEDPDRMGERLEHLGVGPRARARFIAMFMRNTDAILRILSLIDRRPASPLKGGSGN